jgi:dihydrofolate synthase/folylpolyglutamate synthase
VCAHSSPTQGLQAALAAAEATDRIVVFGSFHTVGGVLKDGLPRLAAAHVAAAVPNAPDGGKATRVAPR